MNDHKLEVVDKTKFLGMLLDYYLNFVNHTKDKTNAGKEMYINLFSLKSKNFRLSAKIIINLYNTFPRSQIKN